MLLEGWKPGGMDGFGGGWLAVTSGNQWGASAVHHRMKCPVQCYA